MLTTAQILEAMELGEWFTFIDLKDAYFHIPLCQDHCTFLRFAFQDRVYQFRVLPFGLSLSIHQDGFSSPSSFSVCRYENSVIPGGLANLYSFLRSSHEGHRDGDSTCSSSQSQSELWKELSKSQTTDSVRGNFAGFPADGCILITPNGGTFAHSSSNIPSEQENKVN